MPLPTIATQDEECGDNWGSLLLREGVRDFRPRSRGWRTLRTK